MLKTTAKLISIVFHPLTMVTYAVVLLLLLNPYSFGVNSIEEQSPLILQVFLSTFFLPFLSVVLMYAIGFIKSIEMEDRMDRIIPYIGIGTFYIASYYYYLKMPHIPVSFKMFFLGVVISLFMAFFINNFSKISMHTVGIGGFLGMVLFIIFVFKQYSFPLPGEWGFIQVETTSLLIFTCLLAGIIGSARLFLRAHKPSDLWGGYVVGLLGQVIAYQIIF